MQPVKPPRVSLLPFAAAAFAGSMLLFLVEPLVGRMLLPRAGGAPAVWLACMLFFQVVLLAGYVYVHVVAARLARPAQLVLHGGVAAASLLALPIALPAGWAPPPGAFPVPSILGRLLLTVGLPFFLLSTTAPLVQRWFAATPHPAAADPYFLYAASNLGSFAGLLAYPFLLEPLLGVRAQGRVWAAAYVAFLAILAVCGWTARAGGAPEPRPSSALELLRADRRALRWAYLAAVPSALLLTATGYLTAEVAPVPLLWVAPLALYLLTYVAAFARRLRLDPGTLAAVQRVPAAVVAVSAALALTSPLVLLAHLAFFVCTALLAHAELARRRPPAAELTRFYVWVGVGGAAGGLFSAIVAPLLMPPEVEYALVALLGVFTLARPRWALRPRARRIAAGLTAAAALPFVSGDPAVALVLGAVAFALLLHGSRVGFAAVCAGAAALAVAAFGDMRIEARRRNFFGSLIVAREDGFRVLRHGLVLHGAQALAPAHRLEPTTYYSAAGPLGDAFRAWRRHAGRGPVAAVGLGAGTVACYAAPGERWDFYEINPAVVALATDPRYFGFLDGCAPDRRILLGDARLMLMRERDRYGLIVLDAFSAETIPAHLLTREALRLYLDHLAPGGLIVLHLSNRHLRLEPLVAAHAGELGLLGRVRRDPVEGGFGRYARSASTWAILTANPAIADELDRTGAWRRLDADHPVPVWTDDRSDVLRLVRWR